MSSRRRALSCGRRGTGQTGLHIGQVELDHPGVLRDPAAARIPEQAIAPAVGFDPRAQIVRAPGAGGDRPRSRRPRGRSRRWPRTRAPCWRQWPDRPGREALGAGAEVLHEAVDHADPARSSSVDSEHEVGGGDVRRQRPDEADPHHLRDQHEVGLPQHDRLGLDAAHPQPSTPRPLIMVVCESVPMTVSG